MSDDNLMNLEDDAPEPAAPETPPTETPAEAVPAADPPPEGEKPAEVEAVEVGGQKYVPLSVVLAEREKRQQLVPLAQRAQEQDAWIAANRPYIEFLQANPDFLKRQAAPEPVPQAPAPEMDEAALRYARRMSLYDATGVPDVGTARAILNEHAEEARREAQRAVQPLLDQQIQAKAAQNYGLVAQMAQAQGVDPAIVQFLWAESQKQGVDGLRMWADDGNARSFALMAAGAQAMWKQRQPQAGTPKPPAPVFTEASGGVPSARPAISRLEERVAAERGVSAKAWSETVAGFKPGQTNILED